MRTPVVRVGLWGDGKRSERGSSAASCVTTPPRARDPRKSSSRSRGTSVIGVGRASERVAARRARTPRDRESPRRVPREKIGAMRVLLTGAGGYVGLHVLRELLGDGQHVTALVRSRERLGP